MPLRMVDALLAGRDRFAFYHNLGLQQEIKNEDLGQRIRILPVTFCSHHHYTAYSRSLPSDAADRISAALQNLEDDGTLALIPREYSLAN